MALTKEKLQEILDAGGIDLLLSMIGTSTAGLDAQEAMDAKQERLTLLWTNSTPSSAFAAQTLSIDLTDYDYVHVFAYSDTGSTRLQDAGITVKDAGTGMLRVGPGSASVQSPIYARSISAISNSGIEFSSGYSNATAGTSYLIPARIYGGKW